MKKEKAFQILVLIAAVVQIVSPTFFKFRETNEQISRDPQFTPAGYTFAIWGVITLLALLYSIYQLVPNRALVGLHQKIATKLIGLYLSFSFWLLAASKDWLIFTVIIFICMFFLAYFIFKEIIKQKNELTLYDKIFLEAQIGLYLGWPTIAIFANMGAALKFYGISDLGTTGVIWQTILLIAALSNAIYILYKVKANYFFVGTIAWAFVGIYFGLREEVDTIFLQIVAIIALSFFLFLFYKLKTKTHMQ